MNSPVLNMHRSAKGFTLIDLMVAISIFLTITIITVLNFQIGRNRDDLKEGASLVAGYLEQAQAYALAGKTFDDVGVPTVPRGGWGFHVDDQFRNSFIFFSDNVPASYDPDYLLTGDDMQEEIYLPNQVEINDVCVDQGGSGLDCSQTVVDYVISPPFGERHINQSLPTNQGSFTIKLEHMKTSQTITITVNAVTGLVTVGALN